ncbi:nucleotidyl transferase AbiEii/AbiGii toxin family protein [Arachidicoccus sp.]|uniref:nucleotidyl transferase AbiEii/AbiGii toxin family protein n=1 Tax=Arachidicoccus sp. TaxID=1872624 RepID=UPI003D1F6D71
MSIALHWNTVTPLLQSGLKKLMSEPLLDPFRLVGGTALSLQIGHRAPVDIDLFTDVAYGSIVFSAD